MARIAGIDLPREKRIEVGLTYIYGIGLKTARDILKGTGINPDTRVKDLTAAIEEPVIEKDCQLEVSVLRRMRVPEKVRKRRSQIKRSKGG